MIALPGDGAVIATDANKLDLIIHKMGNLPVLALAHERCASQINALVLAPMTCICMMYVYPLLESGMELNKHVPGTIGYREA